MVSSTGKTTPYYHTVSKDKLAAILSNPQQRADVVDAVCAGRLVVGDDVFWPMRFYSPAELRHREWQAGYKRGPKGRAVARLYAHTEKDHAYRMSYKRSDKGRLWAMRYNHTPQGQARHARRKATPHYQASQKMRKAGISGALLQAYASVGLIEPGYIVRPMRKISSRCRCGECQWKERKGRSGNYLSRYIPVRETA